MTTKERGKVLMNQKANSVADLAAVLWQANRGLNEEQVLKIERKRKRAEHLRRVRREKKVEEPTWEVHSARGARVEGVIVRWANMLDAEYAESWPKKVLHDRLEKSRYTAAFPAMELPHFEEDAESEQPTSEESGEDSGVSETPPESQKGKGKGNSWFSRIWPGRQRAALATA